MSSRHKTNKKQSRKPSRRPIRKQSRKPSRRPIHKQSRKSFKRKLFGYSIRNNILRSKYLRNIGGDWLASKIDDIGKYISNDPVLKKNLELGSTVAGTILVLGLGYKLLKAKLNNINISDIQEQIDYIIKQSEDTEDAKNVYFKTINILLKMLRDNPNTKTGTNAFFGVKYLLSLDVNFNIDIISALRDIQFRLERELSFTNNEFDNIKQQIFDILNSNKKINTDELFKNIQSARSLFRH
jgi:hypothetical protein